MANRRWNEGAYRLAEVGQLPFMIRVRPGRTCLTKFKDLI